MKDMFKEKQSILLIPPAYPTECKIQPIPTIRKRKMRISLVLTILSSTACILSGAYLLIDHWTTADAEIWRRIGRVNAFKELELFDTISIDLSQAPNSPELVPQLKVLEQQIYHVGECTRELIPKLIEFATRVNELLEGDPGPSIINKLTLKLMMWYVGGKRDSKSYYLLDGAVLWSKLRMQVLDGYNGPGVLALKEELMKMQNYTINFRDELDGFSQVIVMRFKKIRALDGDIEGNLEELRRTAKELLAVVANYDGIMLTIKICEDAAMILVEKYKNLGMMKEG